MSIIANNRNTFFYLIAKFGISLLFLASCSSNTDGLPVDIGDKIPPSALSTNIRFMTCSACMDPLYYYTYNGHKIKIMEQDDTISFILVTDDTIRRYHGLKIGDLIKVAKYNIQTMPGWGEYIYLEDGWFANLEKITNRQSTMVIDSFFT